MGTLYKTTLMFVVITSPIFGIKLPRYVDQQLANQMSEGIMDQLIPLKDVRCLRRSATKCFLMKSGRRSSAWRSVEFQLRGSANSSLHTYKLIVLSNLDDNTSLFETRLTNPDPIYFEINFDITFARRKMSQILGDIYFVLTCVNCRKEDKQDQEEKSIGFIVGRTTKSTTRVKRSIIGQNDCTNDGDVERCCVSKRYVSKALIFDNATKILAPKSIPVTFCAGSCYRDMYKGNHNFALLKYYQSLIGHPKSKLLRHLPCCHANKYRDMAILYRMGDGSHEMVYSRNLIVDSCACE